MSILRFLGLGGGVEPGATREGSASVRRIAARLDRLAPEQARYLAAFAYVLARVAYADLRVEASEEAEMERLARELGALSDEEAKLAVEIARCEAGELGGTSNYVVTRELRRLSTRAQRVQVLECLYAVAAADGLISAEETGEIAQIAEELGFTRAENNAVRSGWRAHLSELRDLPRSS
ncbi:MAG: TerB family tellurite resistance protein [Proteobacteria bacterium]|nr:TerB family tellurite resistance protein [Pseudomonadota bacterium]